MMQYKAFLESPVATSVSEKVMCWLSSMTCCIWVMFAGVAVDSLVELVPFSIDMQLLFQPFTQLLTVFHNCMPSTLPSISC